MFEISMLMPSENMTQMVYGACEMDQDTKEDGDFLVLNCSKYYIPKKNPKRPQGQDASFYSQLRQTIGIFDGIGGVKWADSGDYARELAKNALTFIEHYYLEPIEHPTTVIYSAYKMNRTKGSSTACIIMLNQNDNSLHAANLGDSGFMVIREGKTVYRSPVQQRTFNCPFQLSSSGGSEKPKHAARIVVPVQRGDVIVAATDGLFDNLFEDEIERIVFNTMQERVTSCSLVAFRLGEIAKAQSLDKNCDTPFSMEAAKHGVKHIGGKYDDITVVVGTIN